MSQQTEDNRPILNKLASKYLPKPGNRLTYKYQQKWTVELSIPGHGSFFVEGSSKEEVGRRASNEALEYLKGCCTRDGVDWRGMHANRWLCFISHNSFSSFGLGLAYIKSMLCG
jgi:hypothetical protein